MTKNILFLLFGIGITLLANVAFTPATKSVKPNTATTHTCTDPTHRYCDGQCICDGFECNTSCNATQPLLRSYQIQIADENTLFIYDGFRYVGKLKFGAVTALDKLILRDNQ